MEKLNKLIKAARQRNGYTQDDLAKRLGVSQVTIWAWEQGKYYPSGDLFIKLIKDLAIVQEVFPELKPPDMEDRFKKLEEQVQQILNKR